MLNMDALFAVVAKLHFHYIINVFFILDGPNRRWSYQWWERKRDNNVCSLINAFNYLIHIYTVSGI